MLPPTVMVWGSLQSQVLLGGAGGGGHVERTPYTDRTKGIFRNISVTTVCLPWAPFEQICKFIDFLKVPPVQHVREALPTLFFLAVSIWNAYFILC